MGDERQKVTGEKGDGRRRSEEYKLGRRVGELGAVEKAWVRKDVGLESTDYIAEVSDVNVSTIVSVSCSGSDGTRMCCQRGESPSKTHLELSNEHDRRQIERRLT